MADEPAYYSDEFSNPDDEFYYDDEGSDSYDDYLSDDDYWSLPLYYSYRGTIEHVYM